VGYIDRQGEVRIQPAFRGADDFADGRALVVTELRLGYLDEQGNLLITVSSDKGRVDSASDFSDGLAAFSVNGKVGYLDRQGNVLVQPKYDDARPFSEGLAAVNEGSTTEFHPGARMPLPRGGKWGFIDRTGRQVIPLRFEWADQEGFSGGLAVVKLDHQFAYIDRAGKVVVRTEQVEPKRGVWWAHRFSEELALIETSLSEKDDRCGFIDKTGTWAIEPRFRRANAFSEGVAAVQVGPQWGYVDRAGRMVIKPQFEQASDFSEGAAAVRKGEFWSYINMQGQVVIAGQFNDARAFAGGLARVHEGGQFFRPPHGPSNWGRGIWFYINRKGEKVRRCQPDQAEGGPVRNRI
jgi:hypothetical protein